MASKFSKKQLKTFEDLLISKREKTEKQIIDIDEQLNFVAANGADDSSLDDSSSGAQQKEYLHSQKHRHQKHLRDIENAMIRMRNQSYGICTVTGKLIDEKRLMAVPTTTKSIEGKNMEDQKR